MIYKIYTKCISKRGETTRRETSRCENVIWAKPPVTFYITHLLSDLLYAIHRHRHMKLRKKKNIFFQHICFSVYQGPLVPYWELVRDRVNESCEGVEPWKIIVYSCGTTLLVLTARDILFSDEDSEWNISICLNLHFQISHWNFVIKSII